MDNILHVQSSNNIYYYEVMYLSVGFRKMVMILAPGWMAWIVCAGVRRWSGDSTSLYNRVLSLLYVNHRVAGDASPDRKGKISGDAIVYYI